MWHFCFILGAAWVQIWHQRQLILTCIFCELPLSLQTNALSFHLEHNFKLKILNLIFFRAIYPDLLSGLNCFSVFNEATGRPSTKLAKLRGIMSGNRRLITHMAFTRFWWSKKPSVQVSWSNTYTTDAGKIFYFSEKLCVYSRKELRNEILIMNIAGLWVVTPFLS